jgi:hypothetical protein
MKCPMLNLLDSWALGEKMLAGQRFTWPLSLMQERSSLCILGASKETLVRPRT